MFARLFSKLQFFLIQWIEEYKWLKTCLQNKQQIVELTKFINKKTNSIVKFRESFGKLRRFDPHTKSPN